MFNAGTILGRQQVTPLSGTAPRTAAFTPLPQKLPVGSYSTNLSVTAGGAADNPQVIHVTLNTIGFDLYFPVIRR